MEEKKSKNKVERPPYYETNYMDKMYPCANFPLKVPKAELNDGPPSFLPSFSHCGIVTGFHAEESRVTLPTGHLSNVYIKDSVQTLRKKIRNVKNIDCKPQSFVERSYDLSNKVTL